MQTNLPGSLPYERRVRRDALRTLRGSILRSELYALDRYPNQDRIDPALDRPYTVTESQTALVEIEPLQPGQPERLRIFYPHGVAQRTTQWERGNDPLTQFASPIITTRTISLKSTVMAAPCGRRKSPARAAGAAWRTVPAKPIWRRIPSRITPNAPTICD